MNSIRKRPCLHCFEVSSYVDVMKFEAILNVCTVSSRLSRCFSVELLHQDHVAQHPVNDKVKTELFFFSGCCLEVTAFMFHT